MASSYVNDLRLNEMATGDASGTWGDTTNTNLELIGEALGYGTEGITTNADTHTTTVADGATDPGRAMYIEYTGTLDSACTITIAPNTLSRMHFIENGTSGSQNIIIKQGSGATITIPPGDTKAVYLDGAGSGAAVVDAFASLNVVDLKVQDDLTLTSDSAVITFGVDGDTTLTHTDGSGLTLNSTNKIMFNDASQFIQGSSATVLALGATDEIDLTATAIDVNGTMDVSGAITNGSTIVSTGKITADAGIDIDNFNIDGTTIALSSGDMILDSAADIVLDFDGGDLLLRDGGVQTATLDLAGSDFKIQSNVSDKDIIFSGNDGGATIEAMRIDMSAGGDAKFTNAGAALTQTLFADSGSSEGSANITFNTDGGSADQSVANILMRQGSGDGGSRKGEIHFQVSDNGAPATAMSISNNKGVSFASFINPASINLDDNSQLKIGSGNDLLLYHDGSDSYIQDAGTGRIFVATNLFQVTNAAINETMISATENGAVNLYHNGDIKLETNGSGILANEGIYIQAANGDNLIRTASQGAGSTTLYIGNAAIQVSSDERIKKDVVNTTINATEELKKIRVVDFTWDDPSDTSFNNKNARGKWTGAIAQEMISVFPHIINAPRKEKTLEVDNEDERIWHAEYQNLVPVLIKSIQELSAKNDALEARLKTLEDA